MHATQLNLPQRGISARLLAVLTAALLTLTLTASPALADDYEGGSTACSSSSPFSWLHFRASGEGFYQAPGASSTYFNHGAYKKRDVAGDLYGGSWWVNTDGDISGAYGYCTSAG